MNITHYAGVKFSSTGKAYYFGTDIIVHWHRGCGRFGCNIRWFNNL